MSTVLPALTKSVRLSSGHPMPLLGLGTFLSKPGEVAAAVKHAIKVGYRHVDTAAIYGNEKEVGDGVRAACDEYGVKREDIFVTTKLWNNKHHPDDVESACRQSLERLGLDYVDLYLIHWPHAFERGDADFPTNEDGSVRYDISVNPTDTYLATEALVEKGLARSIGVSNFNAAQVEDILAKCKIKPAVNQVEAHAYFNNARLIAHGAERGVVTTAYSPFGSPARPWAPAGEVPLVEDAKLKEIAQAHGKTTAQVAVRYLIQRDVVTIPKSVTPSRIEANSQVFDFSLSDAEMSAIDGLSRRDRIVAPRLPNGEFRDKAHPHFPFNAEF